MGTRKFGSSQAVEFFISLFVGVLAILGAVFIIGFLLVEPIRHPPGQTATIVSIEELVESCEPSFKTKLLEHGCTVNKEPLVEQAVCSNRECDCDSEQDGSVCCCRSLREETFDNVVCPEGVATPQVKNSTLCGCTVCDDLNIQIQLTIVNRETDEPVPAALVLRNEGSDTLTLLGITNNNGHYRFNEPVATYHLALKIVASGFMPQLTSPIRLFPHTKVIALTIVMIPHMTVQLGLGGSALTLRLGSMAAVTAPAGAFHSMDGETYEDFVTFQGMFLSPQDANEFSGVPGADFTVFNPETGEIEPMGVLFVTRLEFMGVEGEQLVAENLRLQVSVLNEDGNLPELCLIIYNETTNRWEKFANFQAPPDPFRGKRQTPPVVLESPDVPILVFAAVAAGSQATCWLQGRTFDTAGAPVSGPFISMVQRVIMSGNELRLRFGTNTGTQSSVTTGGLAPNALCLPIHCGPFVVATLEAREQFEAGSMRLDIQAFPNGTFDVNENAPIEIGTIFTFNELIVSTPIRARPFYTSQAECVASGMLADTSLSEFFRFSQVDVIERPIPLSDSCFIKVQILDCFANNSVTVTSINPTTGNIDGQTTTTVSESDNMIDMPTGSGITFPPPTTPSPVCDADTATMRAACIPYVCGDSVQVRVIPSIESTASSCVITGRSVLLSNSLVSDTSNNAQLLLTSSILLSENYNDPDLGLYFEPGNTMMAADLAEQMCNAGDGVNSNTVIDVVAGVAVTFSCF